MGVGGGNVTSPPEVITVVRYLLYVQCRVVLTHTDILIPTRVNARVPVLGFRRYIAAA